MELLIKASAVAVICAVLALLIKKPSPEIAFLVGASGVTVIIALAVRMISSVSDFLVGLTEISGLSPAVVCTVIKTTAIGVVSKIVSEICCDASEKAMGTSVELLGSAAILYTSLPLMNTVLHIIGEIK